MNSPLRSCGVHGASQRSKQKQEKTLVASWVKSSSRHSQNRQAAASLILVFAWNKASSKETRTQCVSRIPGRYFRLPCSILSLAMRHQRSALLVWCPPWLKTSPFRPWAPNFQCPEQLKRLGLFAVLSQTKAMGATRRFSSVHAQKQHPQGFCGREWARAYVVGTCSVAENRAEQNRTAAGLQTRRSE